MLRSYFILGALSTFGFTSLLVHISSFGEAVLTNIVSLVGGVLSSLLVAWLQKKWKQEHL